MERTLSTEQPESKVEAQPMLFPAETPPAEWEQYEVPAGYDRAGDVIPIRALGKGVEINYDGEMLKATRQSRDRMFLRFPDGKRIQEHGFDKFMSKVCRARADAREYRLLVARSKEAEERARKATQQAEALREQERARGERMASAIECEPEPRSKNKLASTPESKVGSSEPRIINPKTMLRVKGGDGWEFATVPKFLNGLVTHAEQLVYGWMIFRANDDGVFRRSLHSLARDAGLSITGTRKAVASLLARGLILKRTARNGAANEYLFLWCPEMEQTSTQCALVLGDADSETSTQCGLGPVLSETGTSTHCAPLNNKQRKEPTTATATAGVDRDEAIAVAAAGAKDNPDLLGTRLQEFFPLLDVADEWRRYAAWCKANDKPTIAVYRENPNIFTFVKWLHQAVRPVQQTKQDGSPTHEQKHTKPDSFTRAAERRAAKRAREFPEP